MLPVVLQDELAALLGEPIMAQGAVAGGCIANATRVETKSARYFVKWGGSPVGDTFIPEADGLELLRRAQSPLLVPRPIAVRAPERDRPGFLVMDWIGTGPKTPRFWEQFGRGLAAVHRYEGPAYGAERDNFAGSLPQRNGWMEEWPAFFRARRLQPQVDMAREKGGWRREWDPMLEGLYGRLESILPSRPERSALHGDLWSGNFMVTTEGPAALIDPAAYYGHRETDVAMTELFGGFASMFYGAYREAWPLEPGYEERREVYNLYHLINHLNLFGESYAWNVAAILKRFA